MSKYPASSLPENRWCPEEYCPTYPCVHTECLDPDWLDDTEDAYQDPESWEKLWACYYSVTYPSCNSIKSEIPPEEWAVYELKFDRCRRLEEKDEELDKECKEKIKRIHEDSDKRMVELSNKPDVWKNDPWLKRCLLEGGFLTKSRL
jgi:hypothetical protein